jgi:hypothetical protein
MPVMTTFACNLTLMLQTTFHRFFLFFPVFLLAQGLMAQVFMPIPAAGAEIGLAQATVAMREMQTGIATSAQLATMQQKQMLYIASALPFGQTDWQVIKLDFAQRINQTSGCGLSLATNRVPQYSETAIQGHYGRQLFPKLSLGASIGYQMVQAGEYGSAGAPSVRVSLLQKLTENLNLGVAFSNPGQQKLRNTPQNSQLQLGIGWAASPYFQITGEASKELQRNTSYRMGMRYLASERLLLMAGVQSGALARAALGFGVWISPAVRIDVAGSWHHVLGVTPSLGVRYASGKTTQ